MIVNINSQKTINRLLHVIRKDKDDSWSDLSNAEKIEIESGIRQLDEGQRVPLGGFLD